MYDTNVATGNMWWIMTAEIADGKGDWVFRFSKNRADVVNEQHALEKVFASWGGLKNIKIELVNDDTKQYLEDKYNACV